MTDTVLEWGMDAPQTRPVRRVALAFVLVVVCIWLTLGASGQPDNVTAATGGIALGFYCLVLTSILPNTNPRRFQLRIMPLVLIGWSIVFGFTSYAWLQTPIGTAGKVLPSSVSSAEFMVGFAATALWAGYWLAMPTGRGALVRFVQARSNGPRVRSSAFRMYALASFARGVLYVTSSTLGYTGSNGTAVVGPAVQVLNVLASLAPIAILIASFQAFVERHPPARRLLVFLVIVECVYAGVSATKEPIVYAFVAAGLPWLVKRGRVPVVAATIAILAFVFVVVPTTNAFRSHLRTGTSALSVQDAVSLLPQILGSTLSSLTDPSQQAAAVNSATSRIRNIDNVAIIEQLTPAQLPYRSPTDLLQAPLIGVIPRAVWPHKPVLNVGTQFSQEYYGLGQIRTSSAITPVGDLYRYGGWAVLLGGMALLGAVLRFLDESVMLGTLTSQILFVSVAPMLAKGEIDAFGSLASLPSLVISIWLAIMLATRRSEAQ